MKKTGLIIFILMICAGTFLVRRSFYGRYQASIVGMALGFTARNLCSCRFVQERSEALCRENTEIDQLSPELTIDYNHHSVISHYLFWTTRADFQGPDRGCVLE